MACIRGLESTSPASARQRATSRCCWQLCTADSSRALCGIAFKPWLESFTLAGILGGEGHRDSRQLLNQREGSLRTVRVLVPRRPTTRISAQIPAAKPADQQVTALSQPRFHDREPTQVQETLLAMAPAAI